MRTNNPTRVVKQTQTSLTETLTTLLKSVIPRKRKQSANQRLVKMSRLVIPKRHTLTRRQIITTIITITMIRKRTLLLGMMSHTITRIAMMCATCSFKPSKQIGPWCKEVLSIQCTPKKRRIRITVSLREELRKLSSKFMMTPHSCISFLSHVRVSIKLETRQLQPSLKSISMIF